MDVSSVNKILNRRAGSVFRKETVRKVMRAARDLGYDFDRLKFSHRRRYPRKEVSIDAGVAVLMQDGSVYDEGSATIRDISPGGIRITDLSLSRGQLPVAAFRMRISPRSKPFDGEEFVGAIVRFQSDDPPGFGISFSGLEPTAQRKLRRFTTAP